MSSKMTNMEIKMKENEEHYKNGENECKIT